MKRPEVDEHAGAPEIHEVGQRVRSAKRLEHLSSCQPAVPHRSVIADNGAKARCNALPMPRRIAECRDGEQVMKLGAGTAVLLTRGRRSMSSAAAGREGVFRGSNVIRIGGRRLLAREDRPNRFPAMARCPTARRPVTSGR